MFSLKRKIREFADKGDYYSQVQKIINDKKIYDSNKMNKKCIKFVENKIHSNIKTLNCDSGKLLKYLLKIEINRYNKILAEKKKYEKYCKQYIEKKKNIDTQKDKQYDKKEEKKKEEHEEKEKQKEKQIKNQDNEQEDNQDELKLIKNKKLQINYLKEYINKYTTKFNEILEKLNNPNITIKNIIDIIDKDSEKIKNIYNENYGKIIYISEKAGLKIGDMSSQNSQTGGGWKVTLLGLIIMIIGFGLLFVPGPGPFIGLIFIIIGIVIMCVDNGGCGIKFDFALLFLMSGGNKKINNNKIYIGGQKYSYETFIQTQLNNNISKNITDKINSVIKYFENFHTDLDKLGELEIDVEFICISKEKCDMKKEDKKIIKKIFKYFDDIFKN